MARSVDINLSFDALSLGVSVDLDDVSEALGHVFEGNQRRRMTEAGMISPPLRRTRMVCPECGADHTSLTVVVEDSEHLRACRRCHVRFEIE